MPGADASYNPQLPQWHDYVRSSKKMRGSTIQLQTDVAEANTILGYKRTVRALRSGYNTSIYHTDYGCLQ